MRSPLSPPSLLGALVAGALLLAPGAAGAILAPASASHGCGLNTAVPDAPVPGLHSETPNDPAFASGTPAGPATVETHELGSWPVANPPSGSFECWATAEGFGPRASTRIEFDGFGLPNAYVEAFASVDVGFRFNATQPGAPARVPFSILMRSDIGFDLTETAAVAFPASAQFLVFGATAGTGLTNVIHGADARFGDCMPGGKPCGWLDLRQGVADVGVDYGYTIAATLGLSFVQISSPFGGFVHGDAWIDPVIAIDPTAEFAPGLRYVDFVEVEVSPNVVQAVPEIGSAASIGAALAALAVRRRRWTRVGGVG